MATYISLLAAEPRELRRRRTLRELRWRMSVITSNGTGGGNWSSTSTWSGGVVPVSGTNTVAIAAGDTVNLDAAACTGGSLTVGTDPGTGGAAAITIGTSAQTSETKLIVNTGLTLRCRGDMTITGSNNSGGSYSTLQLSSGASWITDPPSGGHYVHNFNGISRVVANGATNTGVWPDSAGGNHCIIKTDLTRGGTNAYTVIQGGVPNTGTVVGGLMTLTFCEISNLGTSSIHGIDVYMDINGLGHSTDDISWTNCTFNGVSFVFLIESGTWHGNFHCVNNIVSNSTQTTAFGQLGPAWFACTTAPSSETKEIRLCSFDSNVVFDGLSNFTMSNNVYQSSILQGNAASWSSDSMFIDNVVVVPTTTRPAISFGSINSCYMLYTASINNQIGFQFASGTTVKNCIFDAETVINTGEAIYSPGTVGIYNNLFLQISGSTQAAWSFGYFNGSGDIYTIEHNTMVGHNTSAIGRGACSLGYGGAAVAGEIPSCRSNLFYCSSSQNYNYAVAEQSSSTFTNDAITHAGYNWFFNPSLGTVKTSAGSVTTNNVPGYNQVEVTTVGSPLSNGNTQIAYQDGSGDPLFTDTSLRNLASWNSVVQGGSATYAAGIASLAANPALIQSMLKWVRSGYVPNNSSLENSSYPGDTSTTDANGTPWAGGGPGRGALSFPPPAGGGAAILAGI